MIKRVASIAKDREAFETEARVAWDTEGPLPAEDEARIDTARARVLAFAKDQALLDWLDEELPVSSQDHRNNTETCLAGGGATAIDETLEYGPRAHAALIAAPPGEVLEGGDVFAPVDNSDGSVQAPAPLVRVTGGALAEPYEPEPFDPTKLVEHFYASLGVDTRRGYKFDLEKFAEWRERTCGRAIDVASALAELVAGGPGRANDVVLQWLAFMRENKLSPATRNRRLAAIKSALRYARLVGMVPWSIDVRGARVDKFRETAGPGMDAVTLILASCSDDLSGLRDRAMLLLAVVLGMRRREIALASRFDYDVDRKRFFVRGKGEKDVWVSVPDEVVRALAHWTTAWDAAHGVPQDGLLFRSMSHRTFGKPITRKGVYLAVVAAGKRAGIKVWTHGLRHTGVTAALDESGGNIRAAQQFARHTDPRVTMKYDDNRADIGGDVAKKIAKKLGGNNG